MLKQLQVTPAINLLQNVHLIIFVGIQATGKSTFYVENFFFSHIRISLDLLSSRVREKKFIETCFDTKSQFVVDNTNTTPQSRERYIIKGKEHNYKITGYYFSSKLEGALERNRHRKGERRIPEEGIRAFHNRLILPSYAEGFDELFYVKISDGRFVVDKWKDDR